MPRSVPLDEPRVVEEEATDHGSDRRSGDGWAPGEAEDFAGDLPRRGALRALREKAGDGRDRVAGVLR
jgi:hypothetical protein